MSLPQSARFPLSCLGIIALVAFVLLVTGHFLGIGKGGMERVIAYPIFLWALGFGGALIGAKRPSIGLSDDLSYLMDFMIRQVPFCTGLAADK